MTRETRRLFERVGHAAVERRGHALSIAIRGSTIRIDCSCGKRLGGGRGCNYKGMDYCISWAADAYREHVRGITAKDRRCDPWQCRAANGTKHMCG